MCVVAHHDFGFSRIEDDFQGARFATLLLYLNEGMVGGETSFPRWVNAETFKALDVKPEKGKAVLFYSQLPDGNLDDFSHHAALPVTDGEKVSDGTLSQKSLFWNPFSYTIRSYYHLSGL